MSSAKYFNDELMEALLEVNTATEQADLMEASDAPSSSGAMLFNTKTHDKGLNVDMSSTSFFFISLFIDYSRAFRCPMSLPVNHRVTEVSGILRKHQHSNTSLFEALRSTPDGVLNTNPVYLFPYEVFIDNPEPSGRTTRQSPQATSQTRTSEICGKVPKDLQQIGKNDASGEVFPVSMIRQTFVKGSASTKMTPANSKYGRVQNPFIRFQMPSQQTYISVMKLFHKDASTFKFEGDAYFDFRSLFELDIMPSGNLYEDLKSFVEHYALPVKLEDKEGKKIPLAEAHERVRHVVQSLVPLRFGVVEGCHRMEASIRLLYGLPMESRLNLFKRTNGGPDICHHRCALFRPTSVQLLQYPVAQELITGDILVALQRFSYTIYLKKGTAVDTSWRSLLTKTKERLGAEAWFRAKHVTLQDTFKGGLPEQVKLTEGNEQCKRHIKIGDYLSKYLCKQAPFSKDVDNKDAFIESMETTFSLFGLEAFPNVSDSLPNLATLKRNPKLKGLKQSMEPHIMVWFFSVFADYTESWDVLESFTAATQENIFDFNFIAMYVAAPCNQLAKIVAEAVLKQMEQQPNFFCVPSKRTPLSVLSRALEKIYRISFIAQYFDVLQTLGLDTPCRFAGSLSHLKQHFDNSSFKHNPMSRQQQNKLPSLSFDSMTKVILYYWPVRVEHEVEAEIKVHFKEIENVRKLTSIFTDLNISPDDMDVLDDIDFKNDFIPFELSLTPDVVKRILSGQEDCSDFLTSECFYNANKKRKATPSPAKKPKPNMEAEIVALSKESIVKGISLLTNDIRNQPNDLSESAQIKSEQTILAGYNELCNKLHKATETFSRINPGEDAGNLVTATQAYTKFSQQVYKRATQKYICAIRNVSTNTMDTEDQGNNDATTSHDEADD